MSLPALTVLDDFKRAPENPLSNGGKWAESSGISGASSAGKIVGEKYVGEPGAVGSAYWTPDKFTEQAVAAFLYGVEGTMEGQFRLYNCLPNPAAEESGYVLNVYHVPGHAAGTQMIQMDHAGVGTIGSEKEVAGWKDGDGVALWVNGGKVSSWYKSGAGAWTLIDEVADASYTTGYAGVEVWKSGSFGCTNFSASALAITNPGTKHNHVGDVVSYQVVATGTETYEATGLPAGLAINAGTGKITGKPTTVEEPMVKLTVKGPEGEASCEFKWVIEPELVGGVNATSMIL